jgi:hypothetical protein
MCCLQCKTHGILLLNLTRKHLSIIFEQCKTTANYAVASQRKPSAAGLAHAKNQAADHDAANVAQTALHLQPSQIPEPIFQVYCPSCTPLTQQHPGAPTPAQFIISAS